MKRFLNLLPCIPFSVAIILCSFKGESHNEKAAVWFAVDDITGEVLVPYEIVEENDCLKGDQYFCAALYYTDEEGNPIGELLDIKLKN